MRKFSILILLVFVSSCNMLKLLGKKSKIESNPENDYYSLVITFPSLTRSHYITDETSIRTAYFSLPDGASAECSRDAGVTWSSCISPLIWDVVDYNQLHQIRVTYEGEMFETSFTPANQFPNLNFLNCSFEVTANETVGAFNGRTFSDSAVACIGDGVTISNAGSDGPIGFAFPNITVIARVGHTATIQSSEASSNIIDDFGRSNTNYIGLRISGSAASQKGISANGGGVDIEDVVINLTGTTSEGIRVTNNGNNTNIKSVNITLTDTGSGSGIYSDNSFITISDSTVAAGYQAVFLLKNNTAGPSFNAYNSHFIGNKTNPLNGTSPGVIQSFSNEATNSQVINLSDSTITSSGGPAILIGNAAGIVNLNLVNTALKRAAVANFDGPAIMVESMAGTNTISVDPASYVCNNSGTSTQRFASILSDLSGNVTFDPTVMMAHASNTDIGICP